MQIWTRLPSVSFQKKRQSSFWKKTLGMSLPRLLFLSWHPFKTNFLYARTLRKRVCVFRSLESVSRQCEIQPMTHAYFVKNTQHQRLLARNWIRCLIDTHRESIRISLWDWNSTSFKNLQVNARGDRKLFEKPPKAFAQGQGFSWLGTAWKKFGWRSCFTHCARTTVLPHSEPGLLANLTCECNLGNTHCDQVTDNTCYLASQLIMRIATSSKPVLMRSKVQYLECTCSLCFA